MATSFDSTSRGVKARTPWGGSSTRSGYSSKSSWADEHQETYDSAKAATEKYGSAWDSAIAEAEGLTGKDYTDTLRKQANEEIDDAYKTYGNELGAIGMRELQYRTDVQDDWTKRRTEASTQAAIDAQSMQESALSTLNSLLSSASGAELDALATQISAASAGSSEQQQYTEWLTALLEKLGYYD